MAKSKILERFGQRIFELRKEKELTQEELADRSSLHFTYIGAAERGEINVSIKNIEKIVKGLGVSLAEFFSSFK